MTLTAGTLTNVKAAAVTAPANTSARIFTLDSRIKALEEALAMAIQKGQRVSEKHIRRLIQQTLVKGLRA